MKFYTSALYIVLILASSLPSFAQKIPLETIHNVLFDFYLPDDTQLSTTERKKRLEWRKTLWHYLQSKPEILELLSVLQPDSPFFTEDIKREFSDIIQNGIEHTDPERLNSLRYALRRHPHNAVRKFAAAIKRIYSYLGYRGPLTSKLSGYNPSNDQIYHSHYQSPVSTLKLENGHISSQNGSIDYLIIGSGPAGSLIAHELAKNTSCNVLLLESGPFVIPGSIITESSSELMESHNQRTTISGGILLRNGCAVGGGTTVNLDLAFSPMLPQIQSHIQTWIDFDAVDSNMFDAAHMQSAYEWVAQKIGTRKVHHREINSNNKILLDAISTATTYCLNTHEPLDKSHQIAKISAVDAFLLPALEHTNRLSILPDVTVTQVLFDSENYEKATGVTIQFKEPLSKEYIVQDPHNLKPIPGSTATIYAKNIIICSGTLGSAEILLRSNIPNTCIGKGIVLHPSIGLFARFDKEIDVLHGLSASVYAPCEDARDDYFFEAMSADPAFLALIHPGSGKQILDTIRDAKFLGGFGIMLIDSVNPHNKVYLDTQGKVQVDYTLSESDKARLRKGLIKAVEMLFDQGAYEVYLPTCEPILSQAYEYLPFTSKDQIKPALERLEFLNNETFISSAHMQGSNKMGNNSRTSVVSHNFKVWNQSQNKEIDNLFVCDSSIFPTSVGANPMQTIYTTAKLFADKLIKEKSGLISSPDSLI